MRNLFLLLMGVAPLWWLGVSICFAAAIVVYAITRHRYAIIVTAEGIPRRSESKTIAAVHGNRSDVDHPQRVSDSQGSDLGSSCGLRGPLALLAL